MFPCAFNIGVFGKHKPTARDYRGNFVIHLDGIENVGYGLPHQTQDLKWPSLVGDCLFIRRVGSWGWSENALVSTGATDNFDSYPSYDLSSLGKNYTIEYVYNNGSRNHTSLVKVQYLADISVNSSGYGFFHTFGVACATGNDLLSVWGCPWKRLELCAANSFAVVADGEKARYYINGGSDGKVFETELFGSATNSRFNLSPAYAARDVVIHGLRVSRNPLNVEDLSYNYAIDKARFGLT